MSDVKDLITALENVAAYADGKEVPVWKTTLVVDDVDVADLRRRLGLSQAQFALRYGFPVATVRNWEQGRRQPYGAARLLLEVIKAHPQVVEDVVQKRFSVHRA